MPDVAELLVEGERVEGFEGGQVVQSMETLATTWDLRYSSQVDEDDEPVIIEAGDAVELRLGEDSLLNGYVDDDEAQYTARQITQQLRGRSRLGDVVDCSAVGPARGWRDATLMQIASDLLEGYEVTIREETDTGDSFRRFEIDGGETIAATLQRAARLRGVHLLDRGGDLAFVRAGQDASQTTIERARVLEGGVRRSQRERFSEYLFEGQTRASDELNGVDASELGQDVEDQGVERLRRLKVRSWGERGEDLGEKAILERNNRAGRSLRLNYVVPGWRDDQGVIWAPNTRVRVVDDWLRVDATLLIVRATAVFARDQYRTQLELTRPEAFDVIVRYPTRSRGAELRDG